MREVVLGFPVFSTSGIGYGDPVASIALIGGNGKDI
jgi:hypothetical protein